MNRKINMQSNALLSCARKRGDRTKKKKEKSSQQVKTQTANSYDQEKILTKIPLCGAFSCRLVNTRTGKQTWGEKRVNFD
uniref:Uncharacterized protein n=1 Tax=Rhizophora mucronata TaxID=61149 RepID=A0A2P2IVT0_RHIMU